MRRIPRPRSRRMIQIRLSQIESPEAFAAALEAHRAALADHRIGDPDKPAPIAPIDHELIDQLIRRVPESGPVESRGPDHFEIAPYEIIDDTPAPPTLAERKHALVAQLHAASQAAIDKILSPAKARLLAMQYADAGIKQKSKRTAAEKRSIVDFEAFSARAGEINRAAVVAAVVIEDLTEADINDWTVPAFD
jgi:hypothetical protein